MFKIKLKVLIVLLCSSCGDASNDDNKKVKDYSQINKVKFEKISTKQFPLDSTTAGGGKNFQYFEENDRKILCYLNQNTNTLIFYDYEKELIDSNLKIDREGPNGVGDISAFLLHNTDSIFVYSYKRGRLYLVNNFGEIINNYSLMSLDDAHISRPFVSGNMPIMKKGSYIVFNGWGSEKEYARNKTYPESLLIYLDLRNNELTYQFSYPEIYSDGIWGMQLHTMYNVFNPNTSDIIVGFPIDDNIYVINDEQILTFPQGSKYFKGVDPLSTKDKITALPIQKELRSELAQTTYRTIHYDQFNNIYLRIIHKAISEELLDLNDPVKSVFPKASILILNNEFNRLGEIDFDNNDYWISHIFVNEDGVHIMKMDFVNEDILSFDVFNLK